MCRGVVVNSRLLSRPFQNDTFHAGLRVCHGIGIRKLKPFNRCLNQAQLRGEETGTGGRRL